MGFDTDTSPEDEGPEDPSAPEAPVGFPPTADLPDDVRDGDASEGEDD